MVLRPGSRGSSVKDLQNKLKAAGFDPGPIDGIYGPKTAAAVRKYQKAKGLTVDGLAGPQTLGSLNGTGSGPKIQTDYTDEETTRFNGLPGHPEVWKNKDTGKVYIVYFPEGMDPPVPLRYEVNSTDVLKTYFGNKSVAYDHEYTSNEMANLGAVTFGDVGDIQDTTGDPWAGFTIKMDKARDAMPWLDDDDVFAIIAAAYLEGRTPEAYEFVGTEWYDTHNSAEKAWLTKVAQDPAQAMQERQGYRIKVINKFKRLGMEPPSDDVIDYITDTWTRGTWSEAETDDQIAKATGGGEGVTLDDGLSDLIGDGGLTGATSMMDEVKGAWTKWLGPAYEPTADEIATWAGLLRDDPQGGMDRLTEMLRGQRMALFPEYTDDTLTWDDISGPWKSMAYNTWGVEADETDPRFQNIVRMNNADEAAKEFRKIGLSDGMERTAQVMGSGVDGAMQTNVRGAV